LALSSHPAPTVAVTVLATVLVAVAGNNWFTCLIAASALLTGQLSIGWSNDLIDSDRDAASRRTDKPVAAGAVARSNLVCAIALALTATVPLSLALGWRAGLAHLVGVAAGWLYNLGLKGTVLSPAPYLIAFGALPAVATLTTPGHRWPPAWSMAAAASIGVAAHFGNVLPDLTEDLQAGVRGLPHRLGAVGSGLSAAVAVLVATLLILTGPARTPSPLDWSGLGVVLLLTLAGLLGTRRNARSEIAFYATMAAAAVDVVLIALSSGLNMA
jgi:4-hydroxybenzoate polyprenyltransferase